MGNSHGPPGGLLWPYEPSKRVVGCLLDVSGSMQEALGEGRAEEPAVTRLQAALRAVLKVANAQQRQYPEAYVFVGLFGLDDNNHPGCPTQVDLCSVIDAVIADPSDRRSGHDLLANLARENDRSHIDKYIRTRFTDDEARFLYIHLQGRESLKEEFISSIPSDETLKRPGRTVRAAAQALGQVTGSLFGNSGLLQFQAAPSTPLLGSSVVDSQDRLPDVPRTAPASRSVNSSIAVAMESTSTSIGNVLGGIVDAAVDMRVQSNVDSSEALTLARRICHEWLADFSTFVPRSVAEVVKLLTRLQDRINSQDDSQPGDVTYAGFFDTLDRYFYGKTPMKGTLKKALEVFRDFDQLANEQHILLLISDGLSTDGNPLDVLNEVPDGDLHLTIATVFLTSDRDVAVRRIYDEAPSAWETDGRATLFNMASKVSMAAHPIPVLTTLGWDIPSSGEGALFATVCSETALEEFCSIMVSARSSR